MKRFSILLFATFITGFLTVRAQKIFKTDYEYQADISVYIVEHEYQADLLLYPVKYSYQAKGNNGLWFFCEHSYLADKKVYFVDHEYQADLKVKFVDQQYKAGWRDDKKKVLME